MNWDCTGGHSSQETPMMWNTHGYRRILTSNCIQLKKEGHYQIIIHQKIVFITLNINLYVSPVLLNSRNSCLRFILLELISIVCSIIFKRLQNVKELWWEPQLKMFSILQWSQSFIVNPILRIPQNFQIAKP